MGGRRARVRRALSRVPKQCAYPAKGPGRGKKMWEDQAGNRRAVEQRGIRARIEKGQSTATIAENEGACVRTRNLQKRGLTKKRVLQLEKKCKWRILERVNIRKRPTVQGGADTAKRV